MKCPKCGFENLDDAVFCIKCGNRIDQKIPCPKCGEYIPDDSSYCPKCGKAIPHKKTSDEIEERKFEKKRSSIARIFNRVSFFVTLFLFISFIGVLGSNYLNNGDKTELYYLIKNLIDGTSSNLVLDIVRISIIGVDFIVTIPFAAFGIYKLIIAYRAKEPLNNAYKHLAVILASKIMTVVLLYNTYAYAGNVPDLSGAVSSLISLTVIHFAVCFGFDTFLSFRRGRLSIFIARIILSIGFYLPVFMLLSFNRLYLSLGEVKQGFIYHLVDMSSNLVNNASNGFFMSSYIVMMLSIGCMLVLLSTAYFIIVFFSSSYFGGMPKFKRFRIIFYMSTITMAIVSTVFLISTLVEARLFTNYLNNGIIANATGLIYLEFVLSILLVGVSVATFNIYHKANSRIQLEEKTTKI